MPSLIKTKKRRPSTLSLLKNMKTVMTLSDRLKLAGIKEFKPEPDVKPNNKLRKKTKKRKTSYKTTTTEKLRNLQADIFSKDSNKNQTLKSKKNTLESSLHFPPESDNTVKKKAEETLSVSLDFIKDCKLYRKKFRHPKDNLNGLTGTKKKTSSSSIDCGQYHPKEKKSQNSIDDIPILWLSNEKEFPMKKDLSCQEDNDKSDPKEIVGDGLNGSLDEIVKTFQKIEPLINKLSYGDVAKIDRKYLESVLSLATNPEPSVKKNFEKYEPGKEKTKQSTGRSFYSGESKNNNSTGNESGMTKKLHGTPKSSSPQTQKDANSPRIVRDLTKSEVQFHLRVKKYIGSQRNSEEIKIEKEVVCSKSELSDGRKKRKHRNKILKNNKTDMIEIPFSSEISKAKDVKELWRRETKKKSENSLTSHSSCTIPESDENPKWKNLGLQSYRILHKLVEEEINKISKKSENKNNIKEVKYQENTNNTQKVHENKTGTLKEKLKSKNILNKLKFPTDENPAEEKEALLVKKKLILAENLHSTYEGEKNNSELLGMFDENLVKTPKKLTEDADNKCGKVPDQAIQNWSILNRLEQAFLALGSSNFQIDNIPPPKLGPKNYPSHNCRIPKKVPNKSEEQKVKVQNQTTNGTLSNRKTFKPSPKTKLNNNETESPKKKTDNVKFSSPLRSPVQSKESKKRNEPDKTELSNVLNQNANLQESLIRKKTYPSINRSHGSNTSHKTLISFNSDKVKKRLTQITNKELKNNEKETEKNKPSSPGKITEGKEDDMKPNQPKPPSNEKTTQSPKYHYFKSGIPKSKLYQKPRPERVKTIEEVLSQKKSQEKLVSQKSSSERPIKERSILSMHGNQPESQPSTDKYQPIQEKTSSDFPPGLKSSIGDLLIKNAHKNFQVLCQNATLEAKSHNGNIYRTDTDTSTDTDLGGGIGISQQANFNSKHPPKNNSYTQKLNQLDSAGESISASNLGQNQSSKLNTVASKNSQELAKSRNLFLWEKDIRRYREIVKDIMSQYKRIDGFLKQSERLGISSKKSFRDESSKKQSNNEEPSKFLNDSQNINLQEYRKKVITEYQTLPFFEYKQLKREENVKSEEGKKRNLLVVSDINNETDFDVKDYQPRIKKVLDSQLYVDKESLFKQSTLEDKFKDKKSSLQEMMLCHERELFKKHCLKSYSLPKTFLLPGGEFCSLQPNNQRQKC